MKYKGLFFQTFLEVVNPRNGTGVNVVYGSKIETEILKKDQDFQGLPHHGVGVGFDDGKGIFLFV